MSRRRFVDYVNSLTVQETTDAQKSCALVDEFGELSRNLTAESAQRCLEISLGLTRLAKRLAIQAVDASSA